jgi:hypothetical protein
MIQPDRRLLAGLRPSASLPRRWLPVLGLITILFALHCPQPVRADLAWETVFTDEQAVNNGSQVTGGDTTVTFSTLVFSDSDGGTFDLGPGRNTSFFSFESGVTGNHTGYIELSFDNENNDPADYLELGLSFSQALTGFQFSILDLDATGGLNWDDGVEVFVNGVNVRTNPAWYTFGSAVQLDTKPYLDGFEAGTTSAASTQTIGNVNFNFGSLNVNSISVRYRTTDDAVANPSAQFVGISDLSFTLAPVPEPVALPALAFALTVFALVRRRSFTR